MNETEEKIVKLLKSINFELIVIRFAIIFLATFYLAGEVLK